LSVASAAEYRPASLNWAFGRKLADWTVGAITFLGAFVIFEPAPYDLLLFPIILVWSIFGLRLNRHFLPMIVLLLLYLTGGIIAVTQNRPYLYDRAFMYMAVTGFLVFSAIFFAAVVAEAPERRYRIIMRAYIAAAVVSALLGIAGYFSLFPGAEIFTLYDRVKGTFQDPNVLGPFLVLPIVLLFQDIFTHPLRRSGWKAPLLLILLFAEFLAFSRAGWGMTVFAVLLVSFFSFLNESRQIARFRIVAFLVAGFFVVALLLTVALSIPEVSSLFADRAQLVEEYDTARYGRFARHILGFFMAQENPLGIGPYTFGHLFGEEEHNMWLKGFTAYGWLGGFSYVALVLWTLIAATPLLFKPRPWQAAFQCIYAVFLGHLLIHNVIDNDHWRHLFLIYGLLWGAIAAEKMHARNMRRGAAPAVLLSEPIPRAPPVPVIPRARLGRG
jgi:hypothetical protein